MLHIRPDEVERIAIDRFISTSGKYLSILTERYERGYTCYDIVGMLADTKKVIKIVRIGRADKLLACLIWEDWKAKMTSPASDEAETSEDDIIGFLLPTYQEARGESMIPKMKARGARVFVVDIKPIDEITARAEQAGIIAVVDERNKPKPTMGVIVTLGEDPLVGELYKVGDIVMFSKHAGTTFSESGRQYRTLELHQIEGVRDPSDGVSDIGMLPTD